MRKVKRKQIEYEGTDKQYIKGNGELGDYDDTLVVKFSLINPKPITDVVSEDLQCDKTAEEIGLAIKEKRNIQWFFLYEKPTSAQGGIVILYPLLVTPTSSDVRIVSTSCRISYSFILYHINLNNLKQITIRCTVLYINQNGVVDSRRTRLTTEWYYEDVRTINNEYTISQPNINISGDSNLHDGYYFPNAISDKDGNWYNAIVLGNQVWLAENLRTTSYNDGTPIEIGDASSVIPAYQDKASTNIPLNLRGLFYNWYAIAPGLAPAGFHVPSFKDFEQLNTYLSQQYRYQAKGMGFESLKCMASTNYWIQWQPRNYAVAPGNASTLNNKTGFNLVPTGLLEEGEGSSAYLWTATNNNEEDKAIYTYGVDNKADQTIAKFIVSENSTITYNTFLPIRCVSDLNPVQFRNWYIQQYGTMQHHIIPEQENSTVVEEQENKNVADGYYFPNAMQDADGNWYGGVVVGNQVWLAENFRSTKMPDGTPILNGSASENNGTELSSTITPYYYWTRDDVLNTEQYGLKYNFAAISNGTASSTSNPSGMIGIAPAGWHIPSPSEYSDLLDYIKSVEFYNVTEDNNIYVSDVLSNKELLDITYFGSLTKEEKDIINATGFNLNVDRLLTSERSSATESNNATERLITLTQGFNALTNKPFLAVIASDFSSSIFPGFGGHLRLVSDLTPIQFRNWYVNEYGTMQHHLDENTNFDNLSTLTIKANGQTLDTYTPNSDTNTIINIPIPQDAEDLDALPNSTKYAASLDLSINPSTFVITGQLLDQDDNPIGEPQLIDLPLESVVVNGTYDSQTGNIILTLQNGNTISFPVTALVTGLQNVQSDWNQNDSTKDDYIKNKPAIPQDLGLYLITITRSGSGTTQSPYTFVCDKTAADITQNVYTGNKKAVFILDIPSQGASFILNQANAEWSVTNNTTYSYENWLFYEYNNDKVNILFQLNHYANSVNDDISISCTTGPSQLQADWNQIDSNSPDYIKNKPVTDEYVVELYSNFSSPSNAINSETLTSNRTADDIVNAVKANKKLSYYVRFNDNGRYYWLHLNESDLSTNISNLGTTSESYYYAVILYTIIYNKIYEVIVNAYSNQPNAGNPSNLSVMGRLINNFVQADWTQTNPNNASYIWNKPDFPFVVEFTSVHNYSSINNENCVCNKAAVDILEALLAKKDIDYKLNFPNGDRVSLTDAGEEFTKTVNTAKTEYVVTKRLFNQNLHSSDYVELLLHLYIEKNTTTNEYTVITFYAIANRVVITNETPNNGTLNIQVNGGALTSFGANQSTNTAIDFKQGAGITLEKDVSNNRITISSESNHRITSKNLVLTTENNIPLYSYSVLCELNNITMTLADLYEFCPPTNVYPHTNVYTWTKEANETGRYAGLCHVRSTDAKFVGKLTINDSVNNEVLSYYVGIIADSPPRATFTFVTNCPWDIIGRFDPSNNTTNYSLLAYLKIPDNFVGTISFTPLRVMVGAPTYPTHVACCFEYVDGTTNLQNYFWRNQITGGTQELNTLTTLLLSEYDPNVGGATTPFGKYHVHIIGDFGGNLTVGSKISDFIVNDFYLHSMEEKLNGIVSLYNMLPSLPTPSAADAGKVLTVNSSGNYELVNP